MSQCPWCAGAPTTSGQCCCPESVQARGIILWEADHQREALERHGLMDLYMGCDSIDRVCERLKAVWEDLRVTREERAKLRALLAESRRMVKAYRTNASVDLATRIDQALGEGR